MHSTRFAPSSNCAPGTGRLTRKRILQSFCSTALLLGLLACSATPEDVESPTPGPGMDLDKDGYTTAEGDCDDTDASIHPDAAELCDGKDNNCNDELDGPSSVDAQDFYLDSDQDAYGDANSVLVACEQPAGYAPVAGDCDNFDPNINPGAAELCDGIDNNCNGEQDGASSADAKTFYADLDRDGYGDSAQSITGCQAPAGYVTTGGDCNDTNAAIHPEQDEVCDGSDNNCDGTTDDSDSIDARIWYRDKDEDGYGVSNNLTTACTQPTGYAAQGGDCNDQDSSINPSQTEMINGKDDDCNGSVDDHTNVYDDDRDGFSENQGDCNDANASISPNGSEGYSCDLVDQDCDGEPDDGLYCHDDDKDGYTEASGDCNDANTAIHPGAIDTACDGIDSDCDSKDGVGSCNDKDLDGYSVDAGDCNDQNSSIHPGAAESFDGVDQDCDGYQDEGVIPVGLVVIQEIQGNPVGEDKWGEWFELYNASIIPIDLYGWSFQDNYTSTPAYFVQITSHVTLQPFGLAILGNCGETTQNGGIVLDYAYYGDTNGDGYCDGGNLQFANTPSVSTPEKLSIFDPTGVLMDTVSYSDTLSPEGYSKQLDGRAISEGTAIDDATTSPYWCEQPATPRGWNVACY